MDLTGAVLAARCAEVSESEETFHGFAYQEGVVAWSSVLSVVFRILLGAHQVAFGEDQIPVRGHPMSGAASWRRRRCIWGTSNEGFSPRAHLVRTVPCICVCRAICGENCVWIVLRGRSLYSAAFPGRLVRDPRIHCCRGPIAGTWRMAVLPPAPQRTVALTTGLHQRDATDKCRDACPLHLRSWGSRRGRSVQLIPGAGHHNRHVSAVIQKFRMPNTSAWSR